MSSEEQPIKPVRVGDEEARPGALEEFTSKDLAERDARPFFFRHVTIIVKICAVILLAGMWVCTVFILREKDITKRYSPWYCLAASSIITLLEIIWFINKCAYCADDGGCCCTCWRILMWLDNWKKGLLYIAFAVPAFFERNMLAVAIGILILILAFLYVVKSCADCRCVGGKKYVLRTKKSQPDPEIPAASPSGSGDTH